MSQQRGPGTEAKEPTHVKLALLRSYSATPKPNWSDVTLLSMVGTATPNAETAKPETRLPNSKGLVVEASPENAAARQIEKAQATQTMSIK